MKPNSKSPADSVPKKNPRNDSKRKGWWRRYLERLNRATEGKPPKCCG